MQPVFLLSDLLIWLLFLALLPCLFILRNSENARTAWHSIKVRPAAMAALVILLGFLAIALLDSLRFRIQDDGPDRSLETPSLLDMALAGIGNRNETTYSAPLAIHSFSKTPGADQAREYARLQFAGAHLASAADHPMDLVRLSLLGALQGALLGLAILLLYLLYAKASQRQRLAEAWRKLRRGDTPAAWRTILGTCALLGVVIGAGYQLATHYHLFGTDKVGQDVLLQAIKSIRTGMIIGSLTLLVMAPLAILFGIAAGYFGGLVDDLIQYLYTTISSIPGVLLIAAGILTLDVYLDSHANFTALSQRADLRLLSLCLILGVTDWISLCRLLRGETLKLRELPYVQAAIALGVRRSRLLGRHILPNVLHLVLITLVLQFSGLVLAEAVLSYVGVGVDPAMISWGNMINGARLEMAREPVVWWSLTAALLFMFALILSANLFADAVRDALDPRLRGS